ncbi:hypothetical protein Tco_0803427 [Tanacetum coccineum]|uniref:Uncharacterized protein n=1 Tax=Tanacetum coccineum TaxID=301880 RepID=A0ABQ5A1J3_9ASTR
MCTKPKRPKNSGWFKEKMLLTEALESRATLDVERMAFLADNRDTCSEQPSFNNDTNIDITSDSNITSYEQYLQETKNAVVQDTNSSTQQDALLMSVIEEMSSQVAKCNKVQKENKIVNETLTAELERYKEQVKNFDERQTFDLNDREKYMDG